MNDYKPGMITDCLLSALEDVHRLEESGMSTFEQRHEAHSLLHDIADRYRRHIEMFVSIFEIGEY